VLAIDSSLAFGPPADASDVTAFERERRIELPEDYRRFLLEVGSGGRCFDGRLTAFDNLMQRAHGDLTKTFVPALLPALPTADDHDYGDDYPKWNADGMLWISDGGCSYGSGLVLSGPERGHVWNYVECWPGWHPAVDDIEHLVLAADGEPRGPMVDLFDFYEDMLAPCNAGTRQGFRIWMESWLESQARP